MTDPFVVDSDRLMLAGAETGATVVIAMLPLASTAVDPRGICSAVVAAVENWLSATATLGSSHEPQGHDSDVGTSAPSRLKEVREWMLTNLSESMSLDQLADRAFLSRRQFTREFRAELGTSPSRWLLERRLDEATRLLGSSGLAVDRIAEKTGFPTASALRAHFKRRTGLTPSHYRELNGVRAPSRDMGRAA
jgi:transcriptional regulator GlxA family with amidase domain